MKVCKKVLGDDISIKWDNIFTYESEAELKGLSFKKNLNIGCVNECMKAMYCLEENECIGRLLGCMVYYDEIIKKLDINSNQGLDWKYYVKGKNKTMNDMKTEHYNNKEEIIFLKKKMFYVYRLFHTRDR